MSKIEIETQRRILVLNRKAHKELLDQYGHGVRPSWVSEELERREGAIMRAHRKMGEINGRLA